METGHNPLNNEKLIERFNNLEARIEKIEKALHIEQSSNEVNDEIEPMVQIKKISDGSLIESKIGEFGLAWLGNIVLFFGIIFTVQFIQKSGYQIGAAALGYILVAGTFILAYFLKSTFPKKVYIFNLNAWLLLFYVTIKLHFFSNAPLISGKPIALLLLLFIVAVQLFFAIKNKSSLFAGFTIILLSIVAVISNSTHIMLPLSVIITLIAVLLSYRYSWYRLIYLSLVIVYLINLFWFLNNPLMGNQMHAISEHDYGFIYLFIIAAIYSLIPLFNHSDTLSKGVVVGSIITNGFGFTILISLYVLTFFKEDYVLLMSAISVFCILYSIVLQLKSAWKISAALYAIYGFVTFSIAIYGIYDFPKSYYLLAIQSLLVVSMAIWFRSKFIIIMNTFLFIIILIAYLSTSSVINSANISFALVALITARIFNWKKDRLTIKTDMLRNIYLFIAFVMILFTLYHMLPARYITLSWTAVAVLYFSFSLILKNIKYRYLALGSMIASAFYFFIVDLSKIELVYRIIALMFLALISIGLSVYYTRKSKRKEENTVE